jgi:glycine C-acetyltransferase/8-amino-7-oxononanoate synthase
VTAQYLVNSARSLIFSTGLPPMAVAAAMAALELVEEQPRRVEKLQANADTLRSELAAQPMSNQRLSASRTTGRACSISPKV